MSTSFTCGDNTALVGYLYDECDPAERAVIDAHVAVCAACAAELATLDATRIQLASWTPPDTTLGFAVTRPHPSTVARGAASVRRAWFGRPLPAWAQVGAAAALFAAGLALGVMRGTAPDESTAGATALSRIASALPAQRAGGVSAADLMALERRLLEEIAQIRTSTPPRDVAAAPVADAQLLARVRALIDESEQRQQRELALRTAQVVRDFDSQRRVDLEQIQRGFGQIEGLTGAEVREQRQMLNYLMRVSQPQ